MAVFCGADDNLVQIPPLESLGTQYFIPEIPYNAGSETAEIRLVATEDSTVVIIRGNYDNLDTVEMTGNIFSRKVELKTVYNITSTKPIQVHLLLRSLASPSTWASVTTIPPVQQYTTKHYFPGSLTSMGIGFGLRIGVDEDGQPVEPLPIQNINTISSSAGIYVYQNTFLLYFLTRADVGSYIIAGDMLYEDINKVCNVTVSSPGDGIDNDCDGLVDEEQCTTNITAGEIDADIDGSFNEDCASGTTPFTVPNIDLAFTPESVTCPVNSGTGNAGESAATGDISSGNNNSGGSVITINNGLVKMNPPTVTPVLAKPPGSPPTYLPLSASAVAVVVQGTAATTEPTVTNTTKDNCVADCICPCGWVNPPKNYTPQELQIVVKEIQEKLRVSKTSLSSVIRSKSSAQDGRTEATAVGIAGIIFIVVLLGAVLLLDLATITRDLRLMANNLRQVFQP